MLRAGRLAGIGQSWLLGRNENTNKGSLFHPSLYNSPSLLPLTPLTFLLAVHFAAVIPPPLNVWKSVTVRSEVVGRSTGLANRVGLSLREFVPMKREREYRNLWPFLSPSPVDSDWGQPRLFGGQRGLFSAVVKLIDNSVGHCLSLSWLSFRHEQANERRGLLCGQECLLQSVSMRVEVKCWLAYCCLVISWFSSQGPLSHCSLHQNVELATAVWEGDTEKAYISRRNERACIVKRPDACSFYVGQNHLGGTPSVAQPRHGPKSSYVLCIGGIKYLRLIQPTIRKQKLEQKAVSVSYIWPTDFAETVGFINSYNCWL